MTVAADTQGRWADWGKTMAELAQTFVRLRMIMLPYASLLDCTTDIDGHRSVYTRYIMKNKKPLWFGGVETMKNYVSYHLMPVYVNPELVSAVSPELKRRMQGKSCFNFKFPDEKLFEELADLTKAGFEDYKKQGFV